MVKHIFWSPSTLWLSILSQNTQGDASLTFLHPWRYINRHFFFDRKSTILHVCVASGPLHIYVINVQLHQPTKRWGPPAVQYLIMFNSNNEEAPTSSSGPTTKEWTSYGIKWKVKSELAFFCAGYLSGPTNGVDPLWNAVHFEGFFLFFCKSLCRFGVKPISSMSWGEKGSFCLRKSLGTIVSRACNDCCSILCL